jgi:hypothetical protein
MNAKVAACTEEGYTGDMYCECGARVRAGEYILSILLIGVIIVGGCVGCGFTIFFAIKKAAELQEMPTQEMSEEIAEAIIVTGESGNNEIL